MSIEARIEINFICRSEHASAWQSALDFLADGARDTHVQEALITISPLIADALNKGWAQLPCGGDGFSVEQEQVSNNRCSLTLVTQENVAQLLQNHFEQWFALCPISELSFELSLIEHD